MNLGLGLKYLVTRLFIDSKSTISQRRKREMKMTHGLENCNMTSIELILK